MRSLLCRWLWLSLLLVAARADARTSHPAELGPYGSLTANTVSAALVVTGLPASSSATVAGLTAGEPAAPKPGWRLLAPKPQKVPSAPAFQDGPAGEARERHAWRPRLFDTDDLIDATHGHGEPDVDEDGDGGGGGGGGHDVYHHDRISIRGDALWLKRDGTINIPLAFTINGAGTPDGAASLVLDSVQHFDHEDGFRTSVIWRFSDTVAMEIAYFGGHEWAESAQLGANPPGTFVQSPYLGATIATADERFDTAILANYNSQLHDGQFNWIYAFSQAPDDHNRWLCGLRTFVWRDELEMVGVQTAAAVSERTRSICRNDLIGPQIGVDLQHPIFRKLHIGLTGKAGLFANFAELRLNNMGFPSTGLPGTTNLDIGKAEVDLAQIVDASVQLSYCPWRWLTLRGGYQTLYARGLAMAPSNFVNTGTSIRDIPQTAFSGPLKVDTDSTLFLDGAFAGGEVRF